jgi:hypothetical protein
VKYSYGEESEILSLVRRNIHNEHRLLYLFGIKEYSKRFF